MLVGEKAQTDLAGALSGASDTMQEVREVAAKINKGDGTLAKLINDATIYNDIQKTVSTLQDVAQSVSEGKGTLGKLVTDSGVYDTAQKVLTQISDAIEDTREQAPVATFTQTMLGGFR